MVENVESRQGLSTGVGLLVSVFSGLLLAFSFENFLGISFSFLAWVCLVPWLFLLRKASWKQGYLLSGVVLLVYLGIVLEWLTLVTVPGYLNAMGIIGAYYFLFVTVVMWAWRRWGDRVLWYIPFLWVGAEFARSEFFFTRFPWFVLAHSQVYQDWIIQTVDIWGTYGVGWIVAFVNVLWLELWIWKVEGGKFPKVKVGLGVLVLTFCVFYSYFRLRSLELFDSLKVALIQGNIPQRVKSSPLSLDRIQKEYLHWTRRALEQGGVDLVVWPETMLTYGSRQWRGDAFVERLRELSRRHKTPFLVGLIDSWLERGELVKEVEGRYGLDLDLFQLPQEVFGDILVSSPYHLYPLKRGERWEIWDKGGRRYLVWRKGEKLWVYRAWRRYANSAVLWGREGEFLGKYDKMFLVPLSEYIPFQESFPALAEFLRKQLPPGFVSMRPGEGVKVFRVGSAKIAPSICFEISFPFHAREAVLRGAEVLVSISNDAWFRDSVELDATHQMGVLRALETRRAVVRAVNAGISSVIFPDGNFRVLTDERGRKKQVGGVLIERVKTTDRITFYTQWGDWVAYLSLVVSGYVILSLILKRRES